MPHPQRAHHQLDRVGQLLLDHGQALLGLAVDAHHHGDQAADARLGIGADAEPDIGDRRQQRHHQQQLLGREGDIGLLGLGGQDRIKRDAAGLEVLAGLLAQLFQHLLARAAFFQQVEPAVHPGVEADRLAEDQQIEALDQQQDRDEDQGVDDGGRADGHLRSPQTAGS